MGSNLPWPEIADFLAEVGAADDENEFVRCVMRRIQDLVPYDLPCVFGVVDPEGKFCARRTVVESKKWFSCFERHYWCRIPDLSGEKGVNTKVVDWNNYQDTEYATDFMNPQNIRYSLGIPVSGEGFRGTLALDRSKTSRPFGEEEQHTMEAVQPHLNNLYRILLRFGLMNSMRDAHEPVDAYPAKLTPREKEIAGLLCRGLSTPEICSLLFISGNTFYRHTNNIFAKLNISSRTELVARLMGKRRI